MATSFRRMQQRRRTLAQWTAENPVLAAGEIGVVTGGDSPGFLIGDGTTAFNSLLGVRVPGHVLTDHDAQYAYASQMQTNGTPITASGADTGFPRITLADAATQRVKWTWEIPVDWDGVAVRWGSTNEAAGTGNIKWQFAYKLIYLGSTNVDGAVTTITIPAIASGNQFDFTYNLPSETASIATANGGLGDKPFMMCSLSRLGSDGTDTLAGGVSVLLTTATRIDL